MSFHFSLSLFAVLQFCHFVTTVTISSCKTLTLKTIYGETFRPVWHKNIFYADFNAK